MIYFLFFLFETKNPKVFVIVKDFILFFSGNYFELFHNYCNKKQLKLP